MLSGVNFEAGRGEKEGLEEGIKILNMVVRECLRR